MSKNRVTVTQTQRYVVVLQILIPFWSPHITIWRQISAQTPALCTQWSLEHTDSTLFLNKWTGTVAKVSRTDFSNSSSVLGSGRHTSTECFFSSGCDCCPAMPASSLKFDDRRPQGTELVFEVGFVLEVFICDLGSDFTGEGVTPLAVYDQQYT